MKCVGLEQGVSTPASSLPPSHQEDWKEDQHVPSRIRIESDLASCLGRLNACRFSREDVVCVLPSLVDSTQQVFLVLEVVIYLICPPSPLI
jgi:hypothetical protein